MTVDQARALNYGDMTNKGRVRGSQHKTSKVDYTHDGKPYIYVNVNVSVWPSTRLEKGNGKRYT